ncbi:TPA: hypothetical protein ACYX8Z_005225 [Klebsiella pneumoniae]|uniref:hypothetical protein n=3 Tax=Klebsiella pneumoniae TaxID=573 RepID=UPI00108355D7|nr:hypothetical protein [Klebsiella pneumoniae]VGG66955.1 Uncharacterised protein [Klebsiella pneumoniae]
MAFDPPIGSSAPEVLLINAKNLDFAMNDITTAFWKDRFGQERKTWYGIESSLEVMRAAQLAAFISQFNQQAQEFDAQLASQESRYESVLQQAGKTVLGRYEDGPWTLTSYNQLVSYGGTFWKLAASVVIGAGYTTAGTTGATWDATDRANFVDVGQDQLRTELGTIFMPAASGNSATDVQLLQAALNVGGQISYNIPGEYLYGSHSVIKSGTSFHTAAGVNWKQVAGKSNPFIVNEAFSASRYAVTSMTKNTTAINIYLDGSDIKSANYITVVCENHPFVRGDWAAFHGAKEFGYDGVMRVISITDANTFIVESHSTMTADSATANTDFWNGLFCFKADTNIEVDIQGRIDGNWRGNSTASTTDFDERVKFMGMSFWGVNNLTIRLNDAFNIRKYAVLLANVRNVHVPRINFYNFSDGLHIQPPFVGISVGTLAGATGDDLLALTNGDYEAYQLSRGHGYSIYVDHLMPQNALTALKAAGAPGYKFWDIDIGSISGSVRLQIISAIRDGILSYTDIGRLRIRSCSCVSQTKDDFYLNTDQMESFIIDDYEVCSLNSGTWCITMGNRYGITGNIKHIGIKNIRYKEGVPLKSIAYVGYNCSVGFMDLHFANAAPLNGAQAVVHTERAGTQSGDAGESAGGFIDTLKISGKFTFPNAGIGRLIWMRAKWNRILLDNLVVEGGERIIHENLVTGNKGKVFCNNVHVKGASGFCNTYNEIEAYHASTLLETTDMPYWLRDILARLYIYGAVQTLNNNGVCRIEQGQFYAKGLDVPVNMTDYPPSGNHGDIVFNTNPIGNPVGRYQFNSANGTWELQNRANISQQPSDTSATIYNPDWNRGFNWVQTLTKDVQFTGGAANLAKLNRGDKVRLYLTQDATGGRAVSFSTAYKFPVAWVNGGTTGQHTIGEFVYDGQFLVLERANVWY